MWSPGATRIHNVDRQLMIRDREYKQCIITMHVCLYFGAELMKTIREVLCTDRQELRGQKYVLLEIRRVAKNAIKMHYCYLQIDAWSLDHIIELIHDFSGDFPILANKWGPLLFIRPFFFIPIHQFWCNWERYLCSIGQL